MPTLKELSYQNLPPQFKVLLGTIDITDKVEAIENLNKSLDYVTVGNIRVGEVTVVLIDPDGEFSKDNPNNFFIENSLNSDGQGVRVQVDIGYATADGDVLQTAFVGTIIQMTRRADGTAVIEATDELHTLYTHKLTDFGIEKTFRLKTPATDEEKNAQRIDRHGFYPVPDFLLPISNKSTTVRSSSTETLTEVPKVKARGVPDTDNYEVDAKGIKLEGDFLEVGATYPRLTMKAPYTYREISELLDMLLAHAGISDKSIVLPDVEIGENFSSEGRIGYETVGTHNIDQSMLASWYGYPTDVLHNSVTGDTFYLINSPVQDTVNRSRILRKTSAGDWSTVFIATSPRTEFWKLAQNGNVLYVMATNTDLLNALPVISVNPTLTFPKEQQVQIQIAITGGPTKVDVEGGLKGDNFSWDWTYDRGVLTLNGTLGNVELEGLRWKITATNKNGTSEAEQVYNIGTNDSWADINVAQSEDIPPDLLTLLPTRSSYDASQSGNGNYIFSVDITDGSVQTVVPTNATLKPQISHFFKFGTTFGNETIDGHRGDTRRSMFWYSGNLYYGYVNRGVNPVQFGVAKTSGGTPTAVYAAHSDGFNDAGFDFFIDNAQLVLVYIREGRLATARTSP